MRKQKIRTLHRKHVTPPVAPLFYHSTVDPAGTLRNLEDPTKVLLEREISRVYRLVPFNGSYRDMSITQVSNFIRETGLPDDDPARIRDPGPEPSTARSPSIFYRRETVEVMGHTATMMVPAVKMWRGIRR